MELRDYLRMLRRGWATILVVTLLGVAVAGLYVLLAPKQYEASAALFVTTAEPLTIEDLSQGNSFASTAVITYAQIVDSSTVLDPVSTELRPQRSVEELVASVTTAVREDTTLIDITVASSDARSAAVIANAAAASAARVIPTLQTRPDGRPLVRMQQVRPAVEPAEAASPDASRILAVGVVAGLFVGLAGTIVRQSLDTRIQSGEELRQLTEVPLLGALPRLAKGERPGLAVRDDPSSTSGEAVRALRTSLKVLDARHPRSLLFTSATGDPDDVHVPTNLAWALAQAGQRVLVVDLDFRGSAVADVLGVETDNGLADVLAGRVGTEDAIRTTSSPLLHVLPSGTEETEAVDLLSGPTMPRTLRQLEQKYDILLLHSSPLLSHADAAVVAGSSGGTLLLVTAGRTRSGDVSAALETLANVHVRPLGVILTGVRDTDQVVRRGGGGRGSTPAQTGESALDGPTLRQHPAQTRPPAGSTPRLRRAPSARPNWTV